MKKSQYILVFLLLFGCLFLFTARAVLCEEKTKSGAGPNREVKAGVFNFEGYHSRDDKGALEGYGIDLLSLLSEYSHLNFNLKGFDKSWQDMLEMLKNGEIDIVSSARRTPNREEDFRFSLPVGRNHTVLSKKLTNTRLHSGDYTTYDGMKIGIVKGSSQNKLIPEFASDKGFAYTLKEFDSAEDLAKALQNDEVDAILSSNLRRPENESVLNIIKSDNFYIIARQEDKDLIDEINYAIEQMNLNEGDWQNDLYFRHYGPRNSGSKEFSQREKDFISRSKAENQPIKAIARHDAHPYSFVENGELKGILPDYFARLMKSADLPYIFVIPENNEDYIKKASSTDVDVVLDWWTPDIIEEDDTFAGFLTDPYLLTGLARVNRKNSNSPVKSIALPENAPFVLPSAITTGRELLYYPNASEALQAVKKGEADVAYVLPLAAQNFINRNQDKDLFFTILDDIGSDFRLQIPSTTEHELITILKKTIANLPKGTLNQLSSQYVSLTARDMSPYQYLKANPEIMLGGALAIALTLGYILFIWLQGRWSRQLLRATETANLVLEEQLAVVEALSRDYANVLAIDPDKSTSSIVKITDRNAVDFVDVGEEVAYERVIEKYIESKVHPDDRKYMRKALSLQNVLARLSQKEEYSGTYRTLKEGDIEYYQFTFARPENKKKSSQSNMILAGFRNIDEVMRREQEQKRALEDALARSRYASAAKTAFLNNMSHDIRTPMNAIIGFTSLASANADNVTLVRRYLDKIMTSGNHLLNLINDVLNMSRIESGKIKIKEEEVSLAQIMRDLRTIVQADIRAKRLDFQMEAVNVNNEDIYCDRLRLNQVLLNVLSNAIKYTPAGGMVNVSLVQTSDVMDGKAAYEFHIKDSGIGMSDTFLAHVFEPFEREQTSTVSGIEGTGLGLAITKNIVDMMAGAIDVQSEIGKGSEFTISFNFRVVDKKEDNCLIPALAGKRVLLVNESASVCINLDAMLRKLGMEADWTTSGLDALALAEKRKDEKSPYAACLLGGKLADIDEAVLTKSLRSILPAYAPIIALSSQEQANAENEEKNSGADSICPRPIFLSELADLLSGHVKELDETKDEDKSGLFKDKHVLLVEDNEMNQEIAQMILEDAGIEVDIVENGQEAVEKMREMPADTYELILMDVQMPVMNGYEATRAIRKMADADKASIPIIAMTANAFDEDREEAVKSGMNGYVPKPIDIENLMNTLAEIMEKRSEAHL